MGSRDGPRHAAPAAAADCGVVVPDPGPSPGAGVRPYVRTGGRTRTHRELALETLVSRPREDGAAPGEPSAPDLEHRAVELICDEPRSVAEVAALLGVPLGVARVLIDDLADDGRLVVHSTAALYGTGPDLSVVERVLTGLRHL